MKVALRKMDCGIYKSREYHTFEESDNCEFLQEFELKSQLEANQWPVDQFLVQRCNQNQNHFEGVSCESVNVCICNSTASLLFFQISLIFQASVIV